MKIILIGNYPNDGFRSMHLFADVLAEGLAKRGVTCVHMAPTPIFGRIRRGASGFAKWVGYIDKFIIFPWKLNFMVRHAGGNSVFHICDHSNAIYTRYLRNAPHLVTCHDVLAIRSALGLEPLNPRPWTGRIFQNGILNGLRRARHVVCVSNHTRQQLASLGVPDNILSVVWNGLNYPYSPMSRAKASAIAAGIARDAGLKLDESGFILHLSGPGWYKNRSGVVRVYAELAKNMRNPPLLFLGGKPLTEEIEQLIQTLNIKSHVVSCPNQSNEGLRALYSSARVLFFPSYAEGFGWPIIEAQACGCPVLTSNRPPMNEVGASAALYCEPPPDSADHLPNWVISSAARLQGVLQLDGAKLEEIVRAGFDNSKRFTTGQMLDGYINCYKQLISSCTNQ